MATRRLIEEALVQVAFVGVAAALPVTFVAGIIGELDPGDPFYPLVAPLVFSYELERKAPRRNKGSTVHLVRHDDVIICKIIHYSLDIVYLYGNIVRSP